MSPTRSCSILGRCAAELVGVNQTPKRLTLEEPAVARGALRRIDLLATADQCGVVSVGEVAGPYRRAYVAGKDDGDDPNQDSTSERPSVHPATLDLDAGSTRMIAIMPLSS